MRSRLLAMLVALVMGAVAVTLVYLYVNRVKTTVTQGQQTRAVLVAARSLPSGTSGTDILGGHAYEVRTIPVKYAEPGAFSTPDQLNGLTLASDLTAGEQLTSQSFRATAADAFLSQFPKGTEALSLPLDFVTGVSGRIGPGDMLDAYVTTSGKVNSHNVSSVGVFGKAGGQTVLLIHDLPVVEVPGAVAAAPGVPASSAAAVTMTVAASPQQAAVLIQAQTSGKLWFALVPQKGT
ncbi:MAG: Flp pilus assembly protein CpaB [Actinomycetota bacterium]|nr:Flp pilus assembly protein CpaB [Actinomycetota bacterium]